VMVGSLQIGSCSRLSVLSLRDNRIARLPNDLGNLRDLHVLDVCGNRLLVLKRYFRKYSTLLKSECQHCKQTMPVMLALSQ
jgi:Leucine-rich repeat (LRR) protein